MFGIIYQLVDDNSTVFHVREQEWPWRLYEWFSLKQNTVLLCLALAHEELTFPVQIPVEYNRKWHAVVFRVFHLKSILCLL